MYLQWIVWILALLFSIGWLFYLRADAKKGERIHIVQIIQTTLHFLALLLFLLFSWSKFHLLWIMPSCYILAFVLGFFVMRIPLIGTILSIIFLFFGHIYLVGIAFTITGGPDTKLGIKNKNRIASTVKNKIDQEEYLISTAPKEDFWETAVFEKDSLGTFWSLTPLRRTLSLTFEEAKREHSWCEDIVGKLPKSEWKNKYREEKS